MGYSAKWVADNLGITRDMIRYYEKKNLLSKSESRNPTNNYRDYDDNDVKRIWAIKLLIEIGFSTEEIYAILYDDHFDFNSTLSKKVEELEKEYNEILIKLNFAKSIKLTGLVPSVSEIGSIKFDDFIAYAHEYWGFADQSRIIPFANLVSSLASKEENEMTHEDVENLLKLTENISYKRIYNCGVMSGYFNAILNMQDFGYDSDIVQRIVNLYYEHMTEIIGASEADRKYLQQHFAKYTSSILIDGDCANLVRKAFGEDGCKFIARAIAYYGGYNIDELL